MLYVCVLIGLDWAEPMMHFFLHVACSCISYTCVLLFNILDIFEPAWDFSNCLLFLPLSVGLRKTCLWHLSINPLWPGTFFIPMPLHLLILPLSLFNSVMMMPTKHSRRTFLDEAFIWNTKSYCRTFSTPTFPLSFTVRDGSHCVTSRSHVLSC